MSSNFREFDLTLESTGGQEPALSLDSVMSCPVQSTFDDFKGDAVGGSMERARRSPVADLKPQARATSGDRQLVDISVDPAGGSAPLDRDRSSVERRLAELKLVNELRQVEDALLLLKQDVQITPGVRARGQKEPGDIEVPTLKVSAMGLSAVDRTELYLYSGAATKALSAYRDLTKAGADGSSYARIWDGKRSAEVHWGARPDQRYLLYPLTDKTWRGESESPNDGARATQVWHVRLADGRTQTSFGDGRAVQVRVHDDSTDVLAIGDRHSENFHLHLGREKFAIAKSADGSKFEKLQFSKAEAIVKARNALVDQFKERATDEHTFYKLQVDMMLLETVRLKQMEDTFKKRGMDSATAHKSAENEIEQTYRNACRIAEYRSFVQDKHASESLPPARLATACAEQIVAHAAAPTEIDQGEHPSCAAASLEVRAYSRYPGRAAKFVADLAFTGHFTGRLKGTSMQMDLESLKAHQDSRVLAPANEKRGIASQIFQVGTYNLMYAMNDRNLEFKQEEITTAAPRGDHLHDKKNRYENYPLNRDNWLLSAYEEIVGVKESPWLLSQPWFHNSKGNEHGLLARNESELLKVLQEADRTGNFPLSLTVDTRNDSLPTSSVQKDGNRKGGRHAINAYGLVPGTVPKVELDNQWGTDDDRLGRNAIGVDQLFDAMNDPEALRIEFPWFKPRKW